MNLRTLIVDDSKLNRDLIRILLEDKFPQVEIVGETASVSDSVELVRKLRPDLIFLDIQLKDGTGFDIVNQIRKEDAMIVFVTAYSEYAIRAIKENAIDYLLKPINFKDLQIAIDKAGKFREMKNLTLARHSGGAQRPHKIKVITNKGSKFISETEVLYLQADGKYTEIRLREENYVSSKNLKLYEEQLDPKLFYRIHHSYLVNVSRIQKISPHLNIVVLDNKQELPISVRRKDEFLKFMAQFQGNRFV